MRPLGRSNLYKNEVCTDEYIICLTLFTIASIRHHHMFHVRRNRDVGGGWCNAIGVFGGGAGIVFKLLGTFDVLLVRFEVDMS